MSLPIAYTPEENLLRVKMDSKTKYVVLEGKEDIPKYESSLRSITNPIDFEPIFVGGKAAINRLVSESKNNNFIAIVDKDFDTYTLTNDTRILLLSKYSIENYILSLDVLIPVLANTLNETEATVRNWFGLDEWSTHVFEKCRFLLKLFHYYQTVYSGAREEWSKSFLHSDNNWLICDIKIQAVINNLLNNTITLSTIEGHTDFHKLDKNGFLNAFPGKMLITSIYRYLKTSINKIYGNKKAFSSKVQNEGTFGILCSNNLHRSNEFKSDMKQAISFLSVII